MCLIGLKEIDPQEGCLNAIQIQCREKGEDYT